MKVVGSEQLKKISVRTFSQAGASIEEAESVSESLVEANLLGVDSHGVLRIPEYVRRIREGEIKLGAQCAIIKETTTTALVDGGFGFGQVAAKKATCIAIEKARSNNVSVVGLIRSNHIGRLGEYTSMIAEQRMIGISFCNTAPKGGIVAPFGGATRRLGTHPFSVAFPSNSFPFLLDYATSVVAEGKLRQKYYAKEKIPEGWIVDKDGRPSVDPADFYERKGALLPFGGYKGYGLSLVIDALGGILTGAHFVSHNEFIGGNNPLIIAINISAFRPLEEFKAEVDEYFRVLKSTPPAEGFKEVMIPGEIENRTKEKRIKEGIPINDEVWLRIEGTANDLGLDLKTLL